MAGATDLSHRAVRTTRAVAASTVATLAALTSHLAAGGAAPPLLLLTAVGILSWLPALLLIGRRLSIVRQGLVIAVSEYALHGVFALGAGTPVPMSGAPSAGAAMASMPGMMPAAGEQMPAMTASSPTMGAAHVVAAVLTLLAWNRGEAAFWAVVRFAQRLRRVVPPTVSVRVVPLEAPVPVGRGPVRSFHLERVLAALARRGPPAALAPRF